VAGAQRVHAADIDAQPVANRVVGVRDADGQRRHASAPGVAAHDERGDTQDFHGKVHRGAHAVVVQRRARTHRICALAEGGVLYTFRQ
jgi:hypothetical protein